MQPCILNYENTANLQKDWFRENKKFIFLTKKSFFKSEHFWWVSQQQQTDMFLRVALLDVMSIRFIEMQDIINAYDAYLDTSYTSNYLCSN